MQITVPVGAPTKCARPRGRLCSKGFSGPNRGRSSPLTDTGRRRLDRPRDVDPTRQTSKRSVRACGMSAFAATALRRAAGLASVRSPASPWQQWQVNPGPQRSAVEDLRRIQRKCAPSMHWILCSPNAPDQRWTPSCPTTRKAQRKRRLAAERARFSSASKAGSTWRPNCPRPALRARRHAFSRLTEAGLSACSISRARGLLTSAGRR